MVVAIYRNNSKASPEEIRVHRYASNGELHIESITNSYAHEIGTAYHSREEVEEFLNQRDRVHGYRLIIEIYNSARG